MLEQHINRPDANALISISIISKTIVGFQEHLNEEVVKWCVLDVKWGEETGHVF
jgi:hypothetical protein